ncbi:hypothetical protein Celaphus_00009069, partial [Cervus elaphus hippelaphus]
MAGGAASPLPSEWTAVRISPGEDVVGQDVLAVRVLVSSDDSSSLRETLTRAVSPHDLGEPEAVPALQRANSFQCPTPSEYQSGRRFQS